MRKITLFLIGFCFLGNVSAQNVLNADYHAMGLGGGYMFNIDDGALNTNPSLLGWQSSQYDHKFSINLKDFYVSSFSPVVSYGVAELTSGDFDFESENENLFDGANSLVVGFEMLESYDPYQGMGTTYDTNVSRASRENYKSALMQYNNVKMRNTLIGFTYVSDNHGTFSLNINKETSARIKLSETFADLWAFGKTSSYFDTLVLIDGSHYANEEINYQDSILSQAHLAFSNDTLTIGEILNGSYVEFVKTRNYSVGWGNEIATGREGLKLFVGANVNLIEGLSYQEVRASDEGISIASFAVNELITTPFKNAGMGASVSFSGTLCLQDKWMFSAGLNNLGAIRWKVRESGEHGGVYSDHTQNDEYENYEYGVSPTTTFDVQLEDANFNWGSVFIGEGHDRVTKATPANYHVGIRRQFGKVFSAGLNVVNPLFKSTPGSMDRTLLAFSYEFEWNKFSIFSGFNNMNQTIAMPIGISFGSRKSKWEVGISVADVLGYFLSSEPNNFSAGAGVKYRIR